MALTQGTGSASHHVILLWPFPVAFLAVALSEAAVLAPYGAAALICLTAALATTNILTTNEYLRELDANGGFGGWTDAVYLLAASVEKNPSTEWFGLVDWGCLNALEMLHEGDLPMFDVPVPPSDAPPAGAAPTDAGRAEVKRAIDGPNRLFIQHTEDKQMFPGVNDRLRNIASDLGFQERIERVIPDRNGRPVFELFRFEKTGR
jgi:hypothetical protein